MGQRLGFLAFSGLTLLATAVSLYAEEFRPAAPLLFAATFLLTVLAYVGNGTGLVVNRRQVEALVLVALRALEADYRDKLQGNFQLRFNVMEIHRRLSLKRCLRIRFHRGLYGRDELEQVYDSGVGCAGTALSQNAQTYYDANIAHEARRDMTATQRSVTRHVRSVLSTPIYRPDDLSRKNPIAILNIDSDSPITQSKLSHGPAKELAAKYAGVLGTFLPRRTPRKIP